MKTHHFFRAVIRPLGFLTFFLIVILGNGLFGQKTQDLAHGPNEQIVFSGDGTFDSGSPLAGSPFGFWIWCVNESDNPYDDCNGAIYIYAMGLTKHVDGEVEEFGTPNGDEYEMTVASTKDDSISAVLRNVAPNRRGPNNTVNVTFSIPDVGTGTSTRAVVVVTGREDK